MNKEEYYKLLKHPKWQKKRLKILERDNWACRYCGGNDKTLHIHHNIYKGNSMPWEYEDADIITLCEDCHEKESGRSSTEKAFIYALKLVFSKEDIEYIYDGLMEYSISRDHKKTADKIVAILKDRNAQIRSRKIRGT